MAGVAVLSGVTSTAALMASLPIAASLRTAIVLILGTYGLWLARAWADRACKRSVTEILLSSDRRIACTDRQGTCVVGTVADDSYAGRVLTTIVYHAPDRRRARTLALLPDMLDADEFRRLRILLRLGKSPPTASD
ncbi:MAG: protein YgfX [Betaproteobacteria bacterium]